MSSLLCAIIYVTYLNYYLLSCWLLLVLLLFFFLIFFLIIIIIIIIVVVVAVAVSVINVAIVDVDLAYLNCSLLIHKCKFQCLINCIVMYTLTTKFVSVVSFGVRIDPFLESLTFTLFYKDEI